MAQHFARRAALPQAGIVKDTSHSPSAPPSAPSSNGSGETPVCEACGGHQFTTLLDDLSHVYRHDGETITWPYRLLECACCGLGFVDPKPAWDVLQTFYDDEYGSYNSSTRSPAQEAKSFKYRIAKLRFATLRSRAVSDIAASCLGVASEWATGRAISYALGVPLQLPKDARIFEMGYGAGDWLLTMAELGYHDLHGYDINANTQNTEKLAAKAISVSNGSFLDNDYGAGTFDCVRLEHVFEHLLDPVAVLEKCRVMLKSGGLLVMSFPCKNSWSMSLSIQDSPALQLPKHLYHHTPASARWMLKRAGFAGLRIRAYSVASQCGATVNSVLSSRQKRAIPPRAFEVSAPLYKLLGELTRKGDFIMVRARR